MEEDAGNFRGREKCIDATLEAEKKTRQILEALSATKLSSE